MRTSTPPADDGETGTRTLRGLAAVGAAALSLGYLPMARWERRMRATGGPGIVRLQLARDAEAARGILTTWGPDGRRAATEQTRADFLWMHTYALTGATLVELARRRTAPGSGWARRGRTVRWMPYAAVACDVVEGVGLLHTLGSGTTPDVRVVAVTRASARTKYFLLLGAGVSALAAATLGSARAGQAGRASDADAPPSSASDAPRLL